MKNLREDSTILIEDEDTSYGGYDFPLIGIVYASSKQIYKRAIIYPKRIEKMFEMLKINKEIEQRGF